MQKNRYQIFSEVSEKSEESTYAIIDSYNDSIYRLYHDIEIAYADYKMLNCIKQVQ